MGPSRDGGSSLGEQPGAATALVQGRGTNRRTVAGIFGPLAGTMNADAKQASARVNVRVRVM